jgi:electron-transferring-flavoprotein dehydrogenase
MSERDVMEYDRVVIGAGPAGLACAIRLKQLQPERSVCVIEKAASLGAHSISGAVIEPGPLDELLPDWRKSFTGTCVAVTGDEFRLLTATGSCWLPVPPQAHNHGNFVVSLSQLTPWMGAQAEAAGVDIFTGFAAAAPLFDAAGAVRGVQLGDMGLNKDGSQGPNYTPGADLHAGVTILAEGCRGSLSKVLIKRYSLDAGRSPPTYGLGIKELWQLPAGRGRPGFVQHTVGWPLPSSDYGGSFLYHLNDDRVYVGLIVGLDYRDPRFQPFEAFQQFKRHPQVAALLEGGELLAYGARTVAAGGAQSLPRLEMPGAMLIGDAAGTLNFAKIKGIHQAIRCGALAAEHLAEKDSPVGFDARWLASAGARELQKVRNIKPGFKRGLWFGLANGALETVLGGRTPWTLKHTANHATYQTLAEADHERDPALLRAEALTPNGGANALTSWGPRTLKPRDRLAAVFLSSTSHDEHQPVHLKVADTNICATRCVQEYGNPCTRFCPAGVYEMVDNENGSGKRLQINAANCVHCKACDIKDPYEIITWTTPEGGAGPNYQNL